jgi:CubicO group peptidase (beta-lactamase class C family)
MRPRRIIKPALLLVTLFLLGYAVYYGWQTFPIMSGYSAKHMCSCVMVSGRSPEDVEKNELGRFPLSLAGAEANLEDSSATATVFGLARQKAIYRKGLGCTLVVEMSEDDLRSAGVTLANLRRVSQDTIRWPDGDVTSDSIPGNVDLQKVNAMIDFAFEEPGKDKLRRIRSIVVVHRGQIIAERYASPFDKDRKQAGWSMTKSITNALVGILVKDGKLNPAEAAPVAGWSDDRSRITLNDLLHASSGLDWKENYRAPDGVNAMLFKRRDMGVFAAQSKLKDEPGKVFYYSSGTTNIISRIVRETVGDESYYRFPYERLFYRIGMLHTTMEPDAGGTFVGSSYCFATARDWARFGLLYLNDGVWNGERILPEGWVKYSTTPASGADKGQYGAQWWLNAGAAGNASNRIYPDAPTDLFWADGYEGQSVFVLPSKDLVIVKLALTQGDDLDVNKFLAGVIEAIK